MLLDDVRSFRACFPSDAMILGGDFNIEFYNPVGPDKRLGRDDFILFLLCIRTPYFFFTLCWCRSDGSVILTFIRSDFQRSLSSIS